MPRTGGSLLLFAALGGCTLQFLPPGEQADGGTDIDTDTDTDADTDTEESPTSGVDLLIAVDNSGTMQHEQAILAQDIYALVEGLAGDVDEVRVAVLSTDLGLSWGGNPYQTGDGWPGSLPPSCDAAGDEGRFMTYSGSKTIYLDDEEYDCPTLTDQWAETPSGDPPSYNPELPGQAACLTTLGTSGCGWEQPLQSIAVGVNRTDQADFHHEDHLLAVIAVSDEDDCSIEFNGLFGVDEILNSDDNRVHVACGNHPEFLYSAAHFVDQFAAPKDGSPYAVLFAAIVGVPIDDDCQGRGDAITDCLDHPDMQLVEVLENEAYVFEPACDRWEESEQVTRAAPGRRFVELASEYMANGFVYSICNKSWTEAMVGIAEMITEELDD
jgi:hypothetical protein